MIDLFTRRTAPGRAGQVKIWITEHLSLAQTDLVTVAELACHEPDCPPVETVVTVHTSADQRRVWHIHKPLADIDKTDILAAVTEK